MSIFTFHFLYYIIKINFYRCVVEIIVQIRRCVNNHKQKNSKTNIDFEKIYLNNSKINL